MSKRATVLALLSLTACQPQSPALRIIDGDTFDLNGTRYRAARYDSPELHHARCARERDLALRAKHRLEALLRQPFTIEHVRCWHGYLRDRYGRSCAVVRVNGIDVGDILIREGLAVSFPQPTAARPWCSSSEGEVKDD
jgi:endonuclease YncB( thermonuclease family)